MINFSLASIRDLRGASALVREKWAQYYYTLCKGKRGALKAIGKKTGFSLKSLKAMLKNK